MNAAPQTAEVQRPDGAPGQMLLEGAGVAALAALAAYFLAISWRKWPDSLIDFGRELYLPWQLSQGAVLYRDAEDFYGPLSQYLNAALFKLFGPSMMVLVVFNLFVFAGIVASIYILFRKAWGPLAAWLACALFISVFGFSDTTGLGNYNYATPYSHEATHGLFVCLLLVLVLLRWLERPALASSLACGLLAGIAAVLKPEVLLAAFSVTAVAAWSGRNKVRKSDALAWLAGLVVPTTVFAAYFARHVPIADAVEYASRAWLSVVSSTRFTGDPSQIAFLGFDKPGEHLFEHALASAIAALLFGWTAAAGMLGDRFAKHRSLIAALGACTIAVVSARLIPWESAGRCLLGLLLFYLAMLRPTGARLLLTVLGVAMLARMALNGRLYQFGFYQAALASLVVVAVAAGELPERLQLSRFGRVTLRVCCACLILPGVLTLAGWSQQLLFLKTYPVSNHGDLFYAVDPSRDKIGDMVNVVSSELRKAPPGQSLLVLPDGEMINYLARMRSPVAPAFFFSSATVGGREAGIVGELRRHPPDWVLLISRDLTEFGVDRYGESEGQGRLILDWTAANYELAGSMGGDPLDPHQQGIRLFKRRAP